jgi:hypothetical protein
MRSLLTVIGIIEFWESSSKLICIFYSLTKIPNSTNDFFNNRIKFNIINSNDHFIIKRNSNQEISLLDFFEL